ncbi:MAG: epoxyqueuosine reductase, partial [Boseongicola sp.]
MDSAGLKERLILQAGTEGFAKARVCAPDAVPKVSERLAEYLEAGRHGQMAWLADRANWRGNPSELWPDAKSVIMLAEPYTPDHDPMADL